MTQDELTEAEQLARCYGPANCWTGTSGTLAAWIIRLLNDATQFEKFLHQELGEEMAHAEDTINSAVVDLVWQIFDMGEEEVQKFFDHINAFQEK